MREGKNSATTVRSSYASTRRRNGVLSRLNDTSVVEGKEGVVGGGRDVPSVCFACSAALTESRGAVCNRMRGGTGGEWGVRRGLEARQRSRHRRAAGEDTREQTRAHGDTMWRVHQRIEENSHLFIARHRSVSLPFAPILQKKISAPLCNVYLFPRGESLLSLSTSDERKGPVVGVVPLPNKAATVQRTNGENRAACTAVMARHLVISCAR